MTIVNIVQDSADRFIDARSDLDAAEPALIDAPKYSLKICRIVRRATRRVPRTST